MAPRRWVPKEIGLDEYDALTPEEQARYEAIDEENATPDRAWREVKRRRRKRKLPKVITGSEAADLLAASEHDAKVTNTEALRNRLILEFMYRAGLRVSEAVGLNVRDVERDGVIRLYDAKGGDGTAYFDADRLLPRVDAWLAVRESWARPGETRFFVKPNGDPVTVRYVQRLVKRLKEQLHIAGKCTPHVLRHTYATELIEEGFTLPEVSAALRHANLATTAVYLHVRDEALRRKMSRRGRRDDREEVGG